MYNLNEYNLIYIKNNINIFYPLYQYILYYPSTRAIKSPLLHYLFPISNPKPFLSVPYLKIMKIKKCQITIKISNFTLYLLKDPFHKETVNRSNTPFD